ncbi:MAG: FAD-dependent oxidoreductase [Mycobacteriales bacterium]
MRVTVVGAGVIGLTCAVRLAEAGHEVSVTSAEPPAGTTSAVAGALWYPYRAWPPEDVTRWARRSREVFCALAAHETPGVLLRPGRELLRAPAADPWWAVAVPDLRRLPTAELPAGFADGFGFTAPVLDMGRYLRWLVEQAAGLRVRFGLRRLSGLGEVAGDAVVNCAGLGAGELVGDAELVPIRGQVVRLANPGLTDWVLDEQNPAGLTYVIPRIEDVVCGGTADIGTGSGGCDPAVEQAILARGRVLVPELADAAVLSRAAGVRPARRSVRLEREGRFVHCYGHGGAGVTLSWGCAEEVRDLVGAA